MDARRIARRVGLCFGGVLAGLAALVVAAALLLQTGPVKTWLAATLSNVASSASGYEVSIHGIDGALPSDVTIASLEIADADGVWLGLRDLELRWRPAALLGGRLEVDRLAAAEGIVARPPAGEPEPAAEPAPLDFALPGLPFEVELRDLSIAELRLGAPLIGQDIAAAIFGSAALGGRPWDAQLQLDLQRLDEPGRAALMLRTSPGDGPLTLSAEVEEPADGIIAGLLDIPGRPPVSLRLVGSGPAAQWQGRLDAAAGDAQAALDLKLALDESVGLSMAGTVDPGGLAGAGIRDVLPRPIAIDAALSWTPGVALDIDHVALSSAGLEVSLRGRFDEVAHTVDGVVDLAASDGALIARLADPVGAQSLRLTARAAGSVAAPDIEVSGYATTVTAPGVSAERMDLTGRIEPVESQRLAVTARLESTGFVLAAEPALAGLIGDAPVIALDGTLDAATGDLDVSTLDVTADGLHASATGRVASQGEDVDIAIGLRLDELAPVGALLGLPATGALDTDLRLMGDATEPRLAIDLDATGRDIAFEDALLSALVGPSPDLTAAAALDGGTLAIERASFAFAGADVELSGAAGDTLDLAVSASAADLSRFSRPLGTDLAGALAIESRIAGPAADPVVTARLRGSRMAAVGISLGDPTADVTVTQLADAPRGEISLSGTPAGAPMTATTGFHLQDGGGMRLDGIIVEGNATRVVGDLSIRPDGLVDGRLNGTSGDLSRWQDLAGTSLAGTAELRLSLGAERSGQRVVVAASGSDLVVADTANAAAWQLDLTVVDAFGRPVLDGALTAHTILADGLAIDRLTATAEGPLADLDWTIYGAGPGDPVEAVAAAGRLSLDDGRLTVERLRATLPPVDAALTRPATVAWGGGRIEIADVDAAIDGGRIAADALFGTDGMAVDATARDLPLAPFLALVSAPEIDGTVSGTARLRGRPDSPTGEVRLSLAGLREAGLEASEATSLAGEIAGRFADGRVDATARLGGPDEIALEAVLSAPLGGDGPLDGRITGTIELSFLPKVVDLYGDELSGRLDLDLALAGSPADPKMAGRAQISGGAYESAAQGTVLRDMTAEVVGDQDKVRLVSFTAGDGNGGTVTAGGAVRLDPDAGFPLELHAALDRFAALRRREATVQATGRIDLTRNLQGGRIVGQMTVDQAELRVPDRLGTGIVTLDVTEVNLPEGSEAKERPAPADAMPLELDVAVDVPGRAFLRGRGLDSEWRGALHVRGTTAEPDITGELNVVRGRLELLGRNFRFDRGQVRFVGGGEIDPELAFTAQSEAEALTVRADVSGTASSPSFALSSEPPLPQDEILARLLFGTSSGTLTPLQAVQLAQTAATLSGRGGGTSVVEKLRESVGLDVLGIEAGSTVQGSSLSIGKYLTDDVYLRMNQGLTPESRRVGVEVRVLPRVTVESDIGAQSQGNVGINWRYDY